MEGCLRPITEAFWENPLVIRGIRDFYSWYS
jgi:hypothetical protein